MVSRGPCTQLATIQNSSKIEFDERKISAISSWVESSDDIVVTRISQAHTFEYGVEVFDVNDQNWCDLDVVGRTSFASNAKIARIDYQAIWIFAWSHKWCVHVSLVIARRQQQTIPKWLIDRLELRTNELSSIIHWNGIIFLVFLLSLSLSKRTSFRQTVELITSFDRLSDSMGTRLKWSPFPLYDCRTQPSGEKRVPDQRYEWENVTVSCHSLCPWTLAPSKS